MKANYKLPNHYALAWRQLHTRKDSCGSEGLGAEIVQKVAGFFGKDRTKSAFNPQDRYSNNIGASFHTYDFRKNGFGMSMNFGNRFNQFLSLIYKK